MGSVYILVNKDMPGLIKIGRTSGPASERAKKLSQSTSVPSPFEFAYETPCDQAKQLERTMHRQLAQYRRPRREFFECSVEYAISLLERYSVDILNNHPLNQKAKELLNKLPENEAVAYPGALYLLQLAKWGLTYLPEYQTSKPPIPWLPHVPRDTLNNDLYETIDVLMHVRTPKEAMEFILETPWDESDKALPEFQKVTEANEGAAQILENLTERLRWWTAIPID